MFDRLMFIIICLFLILVAMTSILMAVDINTLNYENNLSEGTEVEVNIIPEANFTIQIISDEDVNKLNFIARVCSAHEFKLVRVGVSEENAIPFEKVLTEPGDECESAYQELRKDDLTVGEYYISTDDDRTIGAKLSSTSNIVFHQIWTNAGDLYIYNNKDWPFAYMFIMALFSIVVAVIFLVGTIIGTG